MRIFVRALNKIVTVWKVYMSNNDVIYAIFRAGLVRNVSSEK